MTAAWWRWPERLVIALLILAIRIYQRTISPLIGPVCRFQPSCSRYMIGALRKLSEEVETMYYVYVLDEEEHLLGVLSLYRIVLTRSDTPVRELMVTDPITVQADEDQERAAALHRYVIGSLCDVEANPFSIAPSSFVVAAGGRPVALNDEALLMAYDRGMLPVLYGDAMVARAELWCRKGTLEIRRWLFERSDIDAEFWPELEHALCLLMNYCSATSVAAAPEVDPRVRELAAAL